MHGHATLLGGSTGASAHWAPKRLSVPKPTRKERNLRTSSWCGSIARTHPNAGIPRLLERFRSMTENRGVPGSSPGLAMPECLMGTGFSCSGVSSELPDLGTRMGTGAELAIRPGPGARRKPSESSGFRAALELSTTRIPASGARSSREHARVATDGHSGERALEAAGCNAWDGRASAATIDGRTWDARRSSRASV